MLSNGSASETLRLVQGKGKGFQPPEAVTKELSAWQLRKEMALVGTDGDPLKKHDAYYQLLMDVADDIIRSNRPIAQQRLAIKAVANDLGFKLDNRTLDELYDQLDNTLAAYEPDVEPGGTFTAQEQSWLLFKIFLVGLNLLVGMPGAGKSRFLIALVRAHLNDQATFIDRELAKGSDIQVLLVGTDQDRQQWGSLLAEAGLATEESRKKGTDGTIRISYKLHPQIHLKTSGGGFRLDADGMRWIRNWCQQHPGGLLIIDSLSAVLPPGVKEGDETAGRLMRQIEIARQGNTCIVTHHSSKNAAMGGDLGVYSGSGHGSVDRAVSRFVGLGYETHKEAGIEKLHEDSPRRLLTSQKRGAENQRLVLEHGNRNTWDYIGTAAEQRELKREDEEGPAEECFRGWKKEVWIATTNDWLTTDQVFERIAPTRAKQANAKQQVRDNLRYLHIDHGLLEQDSNPAGGTGCVWRRKQRPSYETEK